MAADVVRLMSGYQRLRTPIQRSKTIADSSPRSNSAKADKTERQAALQRSLVRCCSRPLCSRVPAPALCSVRWWTASAAQTLSGSCA